MRNYTINNLKTDIEELTKNNIDKYACQVILYSLVAAWLKYKNNSVQCFLDYNVNGKNIIYLFRSSNPGVALLIDSKRIKNFEEKREYDMYHCKRGGAKESKYANDIIFITRTAINFNLPQIVVNTDEGTLVPEEVFDVIPYAGCGRSPTTKEGISAAHNALISITGDIRPLHSATSAKSAKESAKLANAHFIKHSISTPINDQFLEYVSQIINTDCTDTDTDNDRVIKYLVAAYLCTNLKIC
jgi:hypothetical protein